MTKVVVTLFPSYCCVILALCHVVNVLFVNVQDAFWALSILLSDKKHAMHGMFPIVCGAL